MNKNGEEKAGHRFLVFHQGSYGPKWRGGKWEDAVYCTVVTQIVTSHSRVQDDPAKFSYSFYPTDRTWDDCDSHIVKNTKMLSTD